MGYRSRKILKYLGTIIGISVLATAVINWPTISSFFKSEGKAQKTEQEADISADGSSKEELAIYKKYTQKELEVMNKLESETIASFPGLSSEERNFMTSYFNSINRNGPFGLANRKIDEIEKCKGLDSNAKQELEVELGLYYSKDYYKKHPELLGPRK